MSAATMKDRLDSAEIIEIEPPRPLRRPLRESMPYPVDALGPTIASAVRGTFEVTQTPVGICAQSALASAALGVQGHANVVLPTGHARPLSLYLLSVAMSGDRK